MDETHRWDRELNQDEQLSLALARIVLHAPPWVLLDDTFTSLDDETLERIVDIFTRSLQKTTVIHIGRTAQMHLPLFSRVLHIMKAPVVPTGSPGSATDGTKELRDRKEPVRDTQ
jgi:putative ATP-binding cassette transporter